MSTHCILIVDDEPDIRELLTITISRMGFATESAASVEEARTVIERGEIQLCLTDMRLPDGEGLDIIRFIQSKCPEVPVAVITAYGNVDLAIESLKAGAFDFLSKPLEISRLRQLVTTALKLEAVNSEPQSGSDGLLGSSKAMQNLRQQISKLSRSQAPVHIHGESGSGKEVVARLIHNSGPRGDAAFVPVNCGAIPADLVESELFGHTKGSFTGAHADKKGLFELANGGTLFLDEVGDLPLSIQVKLLRAIQENRVRPVGASNEIPVDIRLLSATHKDIAALVKAGDFRTDLYYRINVIGISVPPLREHMEDVPELAQHILDRIAEQWGMRETLLSDSALEKLCQQTFPGNVRELENVLERAAALCEGDRIEPDDLPTLSPIAADPENQHAINTGELKEPSLDLAKGDLEGYMQNLERKLLLSALAISDGNKTEAANYLGISFRQFRYKLKKLGIDDS